MKKEEEKKKRRKQEEQSEKEEKSKHQVFDQFQLRSISTSAKFLHPEVLKGAPEKRSFSSAGRSRIGRSRASSTGEGGGAHLIGYHRRRGRGGEGAT